MRNYAENGELCGIMRRTGNCAISHSPHLDVASGYKQFYYFRIKLYSGSDVTSDSSATNVKCKSSGSTEEEAKSAAFCHRYAKCYPTYTSNRSVTGALNVILLKSNRSVTGALNVILLKSNRSVTGALNVILHKSNRSVTGALNVILHKSNRSVTGALNVILHKSNRSVSLY